MNAEFTRRAPMTSLREIVERYVVLAGSFGNPVALSDFGFSSEEAQNLFSALDEDYHISRFLHFALDKDHKGQTYQISGETVTHVAIDPAIHSVL